MAIPSGSPIVLKARGRRKRETQRRHTIDEKIVVQLGSLTTCRFTTRGLKNTKRAPPPPAAPRTLYQKRVNNT